MQTTELTRDEWIQAAYVELLRINCDTEESLNAEERASLRAWCAELAPTYYDDPVDRVKPEQAVKDDLTATL